MHQHRKMLYAGGITGTIALVLLALLVRYAFGSDHSPVTARFIVLTAADVLVGMISVRLLGDACAGTRIERRTSGHVEGVRETVDRLAAALPKGPAGASR